MSTIVMSDLLGRLKQQGQSEEFDKITTNIASPEKVRSWSFGEVRKRLTIVPSSQNGTVYSALKYLDQLKIMSVCAANIND